MNQIDVKNEVQNSVILPDVQEDCLPAVYSDEAVSRLPTLKIHHDEDAIRKLRLYYMATWMVVFLGGVACVLTAVGMFMWLASMRHVPTNAGKGLVGAVCLVGMLFGYFTRKVFARGTAYFKRRFLRNEIEAFAEVECLRDRKVIMKLPDDGKRLPYTPRNPENRLWMTCEPDELLIQDIGLGGENWNEGEISDNIIGNYLGMKFRFFDTFLQHDTRQGKNSKITFIFEGQGLIFEVKSNVEFRGLYQYSACSFCRSMADFEKAFERCLIKKEDPQPKWHCFETENFVMNMIRLGKILNGYDWSLRIQDDMAILIIPRKLNVFELSRASLRRSLSHLDTDLQEFVDILTIVSQFDFIEK